MLEMEDASLARGGEQLLRSYQGAWKGELVLICSKCQKKVKHKGGNKKLAKLGKTLRKRASRHAGLEIAPREVACLKMCPKDGVTVCTSTQAARHECSIVRSVSDLDSLLDRCASEQGLGTRH
jgi:predicted metal-binding protein